MKVKLTSKKSHAPEISNGVIEIKTPKKLAILPLQDFIVDLGLAIDYPDQNYIALLIEDFSVSVKNSVTIPTTIIKPNADIKIQVMNNHSTEYGKFDKGEKICKIIFVSIWRGPIDIAYSYEGSGDEKK